MSRRAKKFPFEQLAQAAFLGNGFCIGCGEEVSSLEPDARRRECEACGAHEVYAAEELIAMGRSE